MAALAFACLALAAALVLPRTALDDPGTVPTEAPGHIDADDISMSATAGGGAPEDARDTRVSAPQTTFSADPVAVPADMLARLEAAGNEPLHSELTQLLAAIQIGFGTGSSQLDPALRSYATRMASRFEWNPDTFRVSVTASSAELAEARAGTLRRLFGAAVSSGRLVIDPSTGPDALTLASL